MMCRTSIFALLAAAMTFAAEGDNVVNASVDSRIGTAKVTAGIQSMDLARNGSATWKAWKVNTPYTPEFTNVDAGYTAKWKVTTNNVVALSGDANNTITLSAAFTGCTLRFYGEPNTYTVTFKPNGWNPVSPSTKSVTYGSTYGTLPTPTRTGWTFVGWFTEANGGTQVKSDTTVAITSDQLLYARGTPNKITVTFKPNGWNPVSPSTMSVTYGSTYGTLPTPTRTGWTFVGWFTAANGGSQVTASTEVTRTTDIDLYARGTPNTYDVTLDRQSGSGGSASVSATYDAAMPSINVPSRTGYTFDGYYTGQNGSGTQYYTASGGSAANWHETSVTRLYAKWTANTYTVTFDANGGSVSPATTNVTYGSTYGNLPTPTLADHSFAGWFTAPSGGEQVTSTTSVTITDVQTLYARWAQESYEVQYKAFDKTGELIGGNYQMIGMGVSTYLTSFNDLDIRLPDGYSFKNWNTALDGSGVSHEDHENVFNLTNVANTIVTLYAQWEPNPYEVAFQPNGADGGETMTNQWFIYDVTQRLEHLAFTYAGRDFKGWSTVSNNPSVFYPDGAEVANLTTGGVVNLYANWTNIVYTVAFDANGGTGAMDSLTCTYTVPTNLPACTFTRDGWGFEGWTNSLAEGVLFLDRARRA